MLRMFYVFMWLLPSGNVSLVLLRDAAGLHVGMPELFGFALLMLRLNPAAHAHTGRCADIVFGKQRAPVRVALSSLPSQLHQGGNARVDASALSCAAAAR